MTPPPMMPMDLTPGKSVLPERSLGGVLNSYASSEDACGTRHVAQQRAAREAEQKERQTPLTLAHLHVVVRLRGLGDPRHREVAQRPRDALGGVHVGRSLASVRVLRALFHHGAFRRPGPERCAQVEWLPLETFWTHVTGKVFAEPIVAHSSPAPQRRREQEEPRCGVQNRTVPERAFAPAPRTRRCSVLRLPRWHGRGERSRRWRSPGAPPASPWASPRRTTRAWPASACSTRRAPSPRLTSARRTARRRRRHAPTSS